MIGTLVKLNIKRPASEKTPQDVFYIAGPTDVGGFAAYVLCNIYKEFNVLYCNLWKMLLSHCNL